MSKSIANFLLHQKEKIDIKHTKHTKHTKKTIIKNKKKSITSSINKNKFTNQIKYFYILQNTTSTHLIHYNDSLTKNLEKQSIHKLGSYNHYSLDDIETNFRRIDIAYSVQLNLLEQLNLIKLPQKVQYATEDMTRGLSKFISRRFESSLPHHVISNAFIKLWECLSVFDDIIPKSKSKHVGDKFKVFHICEAPGQMILAAKYFVSKKRKNITEYEWYANSLNPFNIEVKQKFGKVLGDEYGLIRQNPNKWLWGADNTGDITLVRNIKWFRNRILGKSKDVHENVVGVDLIIGDGGLGSHNDMLVLQKIDLAQVVAVMACSRKGGACIIKHFTPYMTNHPESIDASSFFISYIYLYYLTFDEVSLFKPYSSDMTSGEFYVVGKGFRGLADDMLDKLYRVLDNFKINQALFPKETISLSFLMQINGFIEQMANYNIIGYEKTNLVLTCYKERQNMVNETEDRKNPRNKSKSRHSSGMTLKKEKQEKIKKIEKIEKVLHCNDFLDEDRIEKILVPRYNKWVRLYEFV